MSRSFNKILSDSITTPLVVSDDLMVNNLISDNLTARKSFRPDVWAYPPSTTGGSPPILTALGMEAGSTNLTGNLDMSGNSFTNNPAFTYNFAVIPENSYGNSDQIQMRVFVTPANVEASLLNYWVSDNPTTITVESNMSPDLQLRASKKNAGFIIHIRNTTNAAIANPNFNYLVTTHPLTWKT